MKLARPGGNRPCPCGSGRKRKLCCRWPATDAATPDVTPAAPVDAWDAETAERCAEVLTALKGAGIRVDDDVVAVGVLVDESRSVQPLDGAFVVVAGRNDAEVCPPPISCLYRGNAQPPDLSRRPPPELMPFFLTIELTARDVCQFLPRRVRDDEFAALYGQLRRTPDGTHDDPLFSYLQAAVRVAMTIRPTSRAELDAILRRLRGSARNFRDGPTSDNYVRLALAAMG